jgi:hypothetical protein
MSMLTPLQAAAWLFGLAALGGIAMAVMRFNGRPYPPSWFAMGHGLLAGAALAILIYAAFTTGVPDLAKISIALFVAAAAGGAYMNLRFHQKGLALPIPIMVGHALTAVAGFVTLLLSLRPVA